MRNAVIPGCAGRPGAVILMPVKAGAQRPGYGCIGEVGRWLDGRVCGRCSGA